jgi:cyanate permease
MVIGTVVAFAGAAVAGVVYDKVGNYTPTFYVVAGMSFLAAVLLLFAIPPVHKSSPAIAPAGAAAI